VEEVKRITIRKPDDWHFHLRHGVMLERVIRAISETGGFIFQNILLMPNTTPPILTKKNLGWYMHHLGGAFHSLDIPMPQVEFHYTIKITPQTTPEIIRAVAEGSCNKAKLYPDAVTTGSEGGVTDFEALYPVFEAMQEVGMFLLIHCEKPGEDVYCLDREKEFLEILAKILRGFPALKIVFEHVTTDKGVSFVRGFHRAGHPIGATITAHHLFLTTNDVIGGKIRSGNFCLPVANRPECRDALIDAVTSGEVCFFFGSDCAPHDRRTSKWCEEGCGGIFVPPRVSISLLASVFEREGKLENLESFTSLNGATFYGAPKYGGKLTLIKRPWLPPEEVEGIAVFNPFAKKKDPRILWDIASS